MEFYASLTYGQCVLLNLLWLIIILLHASTLSYAALSASAGADRTVAHALLTFKRHLLDDKNILSDWKPTINSSNCSTIDSTEYCSWMGILCDEDLNIYGLNLTDGELKWHNISSQEPAFSALCSIPSIRVLDFTNNNFSGSFPASLYNCTHLHSLGFSYNLLAGSLPESLDSMIALNYLDLSFNYFSGFIPPSFSRLPHLQYLNLVKNELNEIIPSFLGNLTSLRTLHLAYNPFSDAATIPGELGNLTKLTHLWLANCNLHGMIPRSLANLINLVDLDLSQNALTCEIHPSLFNYRSLIQLELYENNLKGPIPDNIGNLTQLVNIDISWNALTGQLPSSICQLTNLRSLHVSHNHLTGAFPSGLALLTSLTDIFAFQNNLSGALPLNLGAASKLETLALYDNSLSGPLPPLVCSQGTLRDMDLSNNMFRGNIPLQYSRCQTLTRLLLHKSQLSGPVPSGFWGSPGLVVLQLDNNNLEGAITSEIRKAHNLSTLKLDHNKFSERLPREIFDLNKLTYLSLSHNHFVGTIPSQIGNLKQLSNIYLQSNAFSGRLPAALASCTSINVLELGDNQFSGVIPTFLASLTAMNTLNLSHNSFSGEIPPELSRLRLTTFDVSFNNLSGPIPSAFSGKPFERMFEGNKDLCGDYLQSLKPCHDYTRELKSNSMKKMVTFSAFGLAFILFIGGIAKLHKMHGRHRERVDKSMPDSWKIITLNKVDIEGIDVERLLDNESVILGSGGAGIVYKAALKSGHTVAIKRIVISTKPCGTSNDDRGFDAEVATLGKIRHKNVIKLLFCCSKMDVKLLVYEYMPNGSLGDLLHRKTLADNMKSTSVVLDWPSRHGIALGAAEGLAYLHHDCSPPIVHRDIKSNNILLDEHFNACIADFGMARLMGQYSGKDQETCYAAFTAKLAGTYGYIAPEHAYTSKATQKTDIYSYGVVLLELVTGKKAVDRETLGDGVDVVTWVRERLQTNAEKPWQVLDPNLSPIWKQGMLMVLRVALLCTRISPADRPSMRNVVNMLREADPSGLQLQGMEGRFTMKT
ncbi:hypothetical protein KP509_25G027200 [Ceratopteris richardii]|uniref:non-specific serine/threonine protein kinase n=1 Tax=Ceratopteris richardii TaxID=49495 RepID=A0A8T2RNV1_CERRI|nr:hypothetical protein KP509_25G027200 [Ceratopteris richardii]